MPIPSASPRSAPLSSDGAFDLRIDGRLDAGLSNNVLSLAGRRVTGAITIAAQLSGTIAKPRAQGSIRLANAEFRDDVTGFELYRHYGAIAPMARRSASTNSSGATPDGGTLSASGEMRLDPAGGSPGAIRVNGRHAQLVANSIVSATADLALTITDKLGQKPNFDGRITIDLMDITVPDRFSSVSAPFPDTKHVNPTPPAQARLTELAKAKGANGRAPLFDATLNLMISAPNRNFVRGRASMPRSAAICTSQERRATRRWPEASTCCAARSRCSAGGSSSRKGRSGCVSSEGWHVQQEKGLPGQRLRSPVVWIAGWRETETSKPINNVSRGEATSHRAVTTVNANVASKMRSPEGRAHNWRAKAAWGAEI